jgi:hypothetical protein
MSFNDSQPAAMFFYLSGNPVFELVDWQMQVRRAGMVGESIEDWQDSGRQPGDDPALRAGRTGLSVEVLGCWYDNRRARLCFPA